MPSRPVPTATPTLSPSRPRIPNDSGSSLLRARPLGIGTRVSPISWPSGRRRKLGLFGLGSSSEPSSAPTVES
jgi:hypothetical protein